MSDLNIQVCPETGICSIIKKDGKKVDLMPDEVAVLQKAFGNPDNIRDEIAKIDPAFAEGLDSEEIDQVSNELK